MTDPILIIGWGSLIWDLDDLAPKVEGAWRLGHGPRLPLEFTRISPKRKRSLVVVIDPEHGVPCPSHAIRSSRQSVTEATADLAARERTAAANIGWVDLSADAAGSRLDGVPELIARWCREAGASGAVWTDLAGNFEAETGATFSVDRGLAYLRGLSGESGLAAREYIGSAPPETDTPLRRALASQPWWRG